MATSLDQDEIRAKLGGLFQKIPIEDSKLVLSCLQSIANERDEALGRVEDLEGKLERALDAGDSLGARVVELEAAKIPQALNDEAKGELWVYAANKVRWNGQYWTNAHGHSMAIGNCVWFPWEGFEADQCNETRSSDEKRAEIQRLKSALYRAGES